MLYFFLDSMLSVATDKSSAKVTVGLCGYYNLPPHLRCLPGLVLPAFIVTSKTVNTKLKGKSMDGILEIFADQIRYLEFVSSKNRLISSLEKLYNLNKRSNNPLCVCSYMHTGWRERRI